MEGRGEVIGFLSLLRWGQWQLVGVWRGTRATHLDMGSNEVCDMDVIADAGSVWRGMVCTLGQEVQRQVEGLAGGR